MKKIAVHLAEGFEEIEAITIIDVLRRAGLDVETVSVTGKKLVTGSHHISIQADVLFEETDYNTIDMIVLPGGMPGARNLDEHSGLKEQILNFHAQKKPLGAICAAPIVFGHLNILNNRMAVCYPGFETELMGAKVQQSLLAVDEHILTGQGVGAALAFALKITEILVGKNKADQLAKAMLVDERN
ncbi:DJ-1 family glyoxalase III [Mangrovibacterium sp.]|uniref:DJ-1 family glyoxalase III n=1 Tax=Mangrovibacterium sp. TaxID=1961364 RepID=UPI003561EE31